MQKVTLNYVWINAVPHNNGVITQACYDPISVRCPIPDRYIQNVIRVRQEHPGIGINIWMDAYKRGDNKGDLSRVFAMATGLEGVAFKGLREIPSYRSDPLFALGDYELNTNVTGIVWRQVDLARLLVLKHEMKVNGGIQVYTDFDMLEPPVGTSEIEKVSKHGFLLEVCTDVLPEHTNYDFYEYENRLMAFCAGNEAAELFLSTAIEKTKKAYLQDIKSQPNGWEPFCEAFGIVKTKLLPDMPLVNLTVTRHAQRTNHSDYPGFRL